MTLPSDKMFVKMGFIWGGVRHHVWFRWYHALRVAVGIGCGIIGWYVIEHFALTVDYALLLALMAVLANDMFEYAYSYARFKTLINRFPEHFTIGDLKVKIPWYGKHTHRFGSENNYYDVEYTGWHWLQILPFHASSKRMHWIRAGLIIGGVVCLLFLGSEA